MTAAALIARNDQIGAGRREAAAIAARLAQHPDVTFLEPGNVLLDNLAADIIEQPSEPACSHLFTVGRGADSPWWRSADDPMIFSAGDAGRLGRQLTGATGAANRATSCGSWVRSGRSLSPGWGASPARWTCSGEPRAGAHP